MKITICGSIAFINEMQNVKRELEMLEHEIKLPPSEIIDGNGDVMPVKDYYALRKATDTTDGWIWDRKEEAMRNHFNKVIWADAILVLNITKKRNFSLCRGKYSFRNGFGVSSRQESFSSESNT